MNEEPGHRDRWQELTKSECFALLAREQLGRVAVVDDRGPMVYPVNFVLDRHMLVLRTDEGAKLDAAISGSQVAFEIDGADAAARTGWSVVVRGEAVAVTDPAEVARLRRLPLHPWAPGARAHYVRILPAVLTGRRIRAAGPAEPRAGPSAEPARRRHRPGPGPVDDGEVQPWEPA